MNTRFIKFSFLILFVLGVLGVNAQQKNIKAVQETINTFFKAFSEGDFKYIQQTSTVDFLLLEQGMIWNLDTLQNKLAKPKPAGYSRKNRFEFFETRITGKRAWVGYHNYADFETAAGKRKIHWLESAVLVKEKKSWKLEMMHSTIVQ
jgi:ketosteroid isomerase-like protein